MVIIYGYRIGRPKLYFKAKALKDHISLLTLFIIATASLPSRRFMSQVPKRDINDCGFVQNMRNSGKAVVPLLTCSTNMMTAVSTSSVLGVLCGTGSWS